MPDPPPAPVPHMSPDEFRRRAREVIDWIADYLEHAEDRPVLSRAAPGDIAALLPDHAPEQPEPWDTILADVDRVVMPGITHWQSPNFFGFFPANTSYPALLGDLISGGLGVQGMLWATSPACTELETRVLDWTAEMLGLPDAFQSRGRATGLPVRRGAPDPVSQGMPVQTADDSDTRAGGGVIQGTASEATLVALLAARRRTLKRLGQKADPTKLVLYMSNQAHSSVIKAAMIAGLAKHAEDLSRVRLIGVDGAYAMRPDLLACAVRADVSAGLLPFFVCATLGTTSSTAMDPLVALGPIAREHDLWLHVDAAFAGAACICPEHRSMLDGVGLADSFCFNPHKWLLTNFDCSCLYTTDRGAIIDALSVSPEYLRNPASQSGRVFDYRDWQVPLGRRFRALKLWFVIRHYGVGGLRAHIREHVRLGALFESLVRADDRFELAAPRTSSLVCFRLRPGSEAEPPAETDARNQRLLDSLNASGRVYLTHTSLPSVRGNAADGPPRTVLRMAIGGARTQEHHVRAAWTLIQEAAGA